MSHSASQKDLILNIIKLSTTIEEKRKSKFQILHIFSFF